MQISGIAIDETPSSLARWTALQAHDPTDAAVIAGFLDDSGHAAAQQPAS